MLPEPPQSFEPEISSFLVWVQLEKGLSPNTVDSYERDLIQCALHLEAQGISGWQKVGYRKSFRLVIFADRARICSHKFIQKIICSANACQVLKG